MRILILLKLLILVSCASDPYRQIASEQIVQRGEANASKSFVKLFSESSFYLELRDSQNNLVDVDINEIQARYYQELLEVKVRRLVKGKYEVGIKEEISNLAKLKFFVQKKILSHKLVAPHKPFREHSKFEILGHTNHLLRLRLTLKDKFGSGVEMSHHPDIILEGLGEISDIQMVKKGVWEFSLAYPEENQILYLSVRANEVLLERLFRFQHIEK